MPPEILIALAAFAQVNPGTAASPKPYSPVGASYSIAFPSKPVEKTRVARFPSGSVTFAVASVKGKGVVAYSVSSGEFRDAADPKAVLDALRDDVISQSKGTLIGESDLEIRGYAGRELRVQIPRNIAVGGALLKARVLLVDRRGIEVVAIMPATQAESPEASAFLKSFQLTASPAIARSSPTSGPKVAAPDDRSKAESPSTPPGKAAWKEFRSTEFGFKILMPEEPTRNAITKDSSGGKLNISSFACLFGGTLFQLTVSEFENPAIHSEVGQADATEAGVVDGLFNGGKIEARRFVRQAGLLGKEAEGHSGKNLLGNEDFTRARIYWLGKRIFTILFTESTTGASNGKGLEFLDSFAPIDGASDGRDSLGRVNLALWKEFVPPNSGFSVRLPETPLTTRTGPASKLSPGTKEFNVVDGTSVFTLRIADAPPGFKQEQVPAILELLANRVIDQGKLRGLRTLTQDGVKGREVIFEVTGNENQLGAIVTCRVFLTTRWIILLTEIARDDKKPGDRGRAYFDSIKFTER